MPFTPDAVTVFISARITQVTRCGAKDVSPEFPEYKNWISAFGMKVIFQNHVPEPRRPLALTGGCLLTPL